MSKSLHQLFSERPPSTYEIIAGDLKPRSSSSLLLSPKRKLNVSEPTQPTVKKVKSNSPITEASTIPQSSSINSTISPRKDVDTKELGQSTVDTSNSSILDNESSARSDTTPAEPRETTKERSKELEINKSVGCLDRVIEQVQPPRSSFETLDTRISTSHHTPASTYVPPSIENLPIHSKTVDPMSPLERILSAISSTKSDQNTPFIKQAAQSVGSTIMNLPQSTPFPNSNQTNSFTAPYISPSPPTIQLVNRDPRLSRGNFANKRPVSMITPLEDILRVVEESKKELVASQPVVTQQQPPVNPEKPMNSKKRRQIHKKQRLREAKKKKMENRIHHRLAGHHFDQPYNKNDEEKDVDDLFKEFEEIKAKHGMSSQVKEESLVQVKEEPLAQAGIPSQVQSSLSYPVEKQQHNLPKPVNSSQVTNVLNQVKVEESIPNPPAKTMNANNGKSNKKTKNGKKNGQNGPNKTPTPVSNSALPDYHLPNETRVKVENQKKPFVPKKVCIYFAKGNCQAGDKCTFKHEAPPPPPTSKIVCQFFKTGSCAQFDECKFSHDLKIEPCRFFHMSGTCEQGDRCLYSHEPLNQDRLERLRLLTGPCRFYHFKGYCNNRDTCLFSHDEAEVEKLKQVESTITPCKFFKLGTCGKGDDCFYSH